jgi:hypothetical protein
MISSNAASARASGTCWAVAQVGVINHIAARMKPARDMFLNPKFMTLISRADRTV